MDRDAFLNVIQGQLAVVVDEYDGRPIDPSGDLSETCIVQSGWLRSTVTEAARTWHRP